MTVRRQPRARTGSGGGAPSMKGKDPRARGGQPTVGEDTVRNQLLQRLEEVPSTATAEELRATLNAVVRALTGKKAI